MGLRERVQGIREFFREDNPNYLGYVTGLSPRYSSGPRSEIVKVIKHGRGKCVTPDELQLYTGRSASENQPYIDEMKDKGFIKEREITRPKTGEVVELICFTKEALQPIG